MIFRLSQKLAARLKVSPKLCLPLDVNPFVDWSANLFMAARAQYILITNTSSLYSMVIFGRGIVDDGQFLDAALIAMQEYMEDEGTEFIYRKFVALASAQVRFSKALNRSVIGSMDPSANSHQGGSAAYTGHARTQQRRLICSPLARPRC
jgi:hypothetical protein